MNEYVYLNGEYLNNLRVADDVVSTDSELDKRTRRSDFETGENSYYVIRD